MKNYTIRITSNAPCLHVSPAAVSGRVHPVVMLTRSPSTRRIQPAPDGACGFTDALPSFAFLRAVVPARRKRCRINRRH